MPEGEQGIEGVFSVEMIIGPVSVEAATRVPKRVQKVEATLVDIAGHAAVHGGQRV